MAALSGAVVRVLAAVALAATAACAVGPRQGEGVVREAGGAVDDLGPAVRVLLATVAAPALSGPGAWRLYGTDGRSVVVRGARDESWRLERRGRSLRAVRGDGVATAWRRGPLVARPLDADGLLAFGGRRYRGELAFTAADSGVLVVNRVAVEEYLRGVVPLEIGPRPASEHAAAEAQAVAARSYTYTRLRGGAVRQFDLHAGVADQVYGGVDAERAVTDAAVRETAGLVLTFGGRLVSAPYHSTCGGSTAEAPEVWRAAGEPHLRRVSDRIPGTGRFYCDPAPRFRWTRTFEADELRRLLDRYLGAYAAVPAGGVGAVRDVQLEATTPSGRAGHLVIGTDRGVFRLRGNDIRYVLRSAGGELLNSTYFSVHRPPARRGESPAVVTLEGAGYGHGVGMCQWGAIGRARAGQDFRTILRTYYPGTSVGYAQ